MILSKLREMEDSRWGEKHYITGGDKRKNPEKLRKLKRFNSLLHDLARLVLKQLTYSSLAEMKLELTLVQF